MKSTTFDTLAHTLAEFARSEYARSEYARSIYALFTGV